MFGSVDRLTLRVDKFSVNKKPLVTLTENTMVHFNPETNPETFKEVNIFILQ
jgi:hypothetical protein